MHNGEKGVFLRVIHRLGLFIVGFELSYSPLFSAFLLKTVDIPPCLCLVPAGFIGNEQNVPEC